VLPGECLRELPPLSVRDEKPVEVLLTPLVLSASLWTALLLRSCERERLWPGLRTSKAFLRADMTAVCWEGGVRSAAVPSFEICCCYW
jgi:hypothetical protein